MRSLLKTIASIFLLFQLSAISAETVCGYNPDATITITAPNGEKTSFVTGIAYTPEKHQQGLMNCKELKKGTGLFFIFNEESPHYFWMKNTPIELAIIYINSDYKIVSIRKGIPFSEKTIPSIFPAMYVLEINWNESMKIKSGDKVSYKMN